MKTFDPTKPVQTRDGRKARIICVDAKSPCGNIVALITSSNNETTIMYYPNGRYRKYETYDNPIDLVNVPVRVSKWQNVYTDGTVGGLWNAPDGVVKGEVNRLGQNEYILEDGVCVDVVFHRNNTNGS